MLNKWSIMVDSPNIDRNLISFSKDGAYLAVLFYKNSTLILLDGENGNILAS